MENRQVTVTRFGGPEVLGLIRGRVPSPGPGEVRLRVKASSLAFTDTLIRRNLYPMPTAEPPLVLGYDVVERIDALGEGVSGWAIGDRVADLTRIRGAQDWLCLPADTLVRVPGGLAAERAKPMILSHMTAWQALLRLGGLAEGHRVLVLGASGAVGLAALDVCRDAGAEAVGVASAAREAVIAALGATPLAYDEPAFDVALARHAAEGFDVILDVAGSLPYATLDGWLRPGGRIVVAGFSSMRSGAQGLASPEAAEAFRARLGERIGEVFARQADPAHPGRMAFYDVSTLRGERPAWFREDLAALFAAAESGRLAPHVDGVFGLEDAAEAHRRLDAGAVVGRLVLRVDPA